MITASLTYKGTLRTECTHVRSGNTTTTDAPLDNHGKGENFSPTDLLATSLLSCMVTVMGIAAEARGWEMGEVTGEVTKIMTDSPRRVSGLKVFISFEGADFTEKQQELLVDIATNCPVAHSLNPAIDIDLEIEFPQATPD